MATSAGTAFVEVQPSLSSFQSKLASYFGGSSFGKYGVAAGGAFAAAFAAAGAGKVLFDIGKQFDTAFDTIRTKTGATGKELGKLEDQFKSVVSSVPTDFQTAADAVGGLNQRLDEGVKPMTQLAKQLTALSKLTGEDINTEVSTITRLFGDWSVATKDQTEVLDQLFRLTQETGISMTDLSELMVQFGSPLRQLGFHFSEAAAMFARFEREGVNMQTLLPGLRFALKNISLPTTDLAKQFKQLGISTKDPHDALLQIFDVLSKDKISEADQTMLASGVFGGRAWADMKAAIEEGRFSFDDLISTMKGGDETIRGTERSTRDFSEQWILFKNRVMVWLEPLATTVFKNLGEGMKIINQTIQGHGGFSESISSVSEALQGVVQSLKDFWDQSAIFRKAVEIMGNIVQRVLPAIETLFRGFKQTIQGIVQLISGILTGHFDRAWEGVKNIFKGALGGILAQLRAVTAPIREIASQIGDALKNQIGAALDWVKDAFHNTVDAVRDALRAMSAVAHDIARAIAAPFRWLAGVVKKVADFIVNAVNKISDAMGSLQDKIPDLNISPPGFPDLIPGGQKGMMVVPGQSTGDNHLVQARVESGEVLAVVNRNAAKNLMALNAAVPRFQGGGYTGMQPGIISLIQNVIRQFGGAMSSGYRPGDPGFHGRGMAADWVGGDWTGASRYINSIGPSLLEGIHQAPPGQQVSWDSGHQVPPSFWGPSTWAAHVSHIHMAIAGAVSGAIKGMAQQIGRIRIHGHGPLAGAAQGAADLMRKSANRYLGTLMPAASFDTGATSGGLGIPQLEALWTGAHGPPGIAELMAHIALAESGGVPTATNPSGATGLWQILGALVPGNLLIPRINALNAVAKYQTQGLSAWDASRGVWGPWASAHGFKNGGIVPGVGPKAIIAHGGERITPAGASAIELYINADGVNIDEVYGIVDGHTVEVFRQGGKNVSRARQLAGRAGRI